MANEQKEKNVNVDNQKEIESVGNVGEVIDASPIQLKQAELEHHYKNACAEQVALEWQRDSIIRQLEAAKDRRKTFADQLELLDQLAS